MPDIIGLVFEIVFLGLGVYLYLFARGFFTPSRPEAAEKVNRFRKANQGWMRIVGLALAAVFLLNLVLHVRDLVAG
jgi:hypothetical protein